MRISSLFQPCIWLLCLGWIATAAAQKQPNIQDISQWLPATAKVDGKLSEWGNELQASNKATGVEYTLANDDKNLYLAIRSRDKGTTAKIMAGGITLSVNSTANNPGKGPLISFPVRKPGYNQEGFPVYKVLLDSARIQDEILQFREIKVFRFKGISDSLLSIYNEHGISNKWAYSNGALVSELVIPLSLIGVSAQGPVFSYNITLNGVTPPKEDPLAPPPPMAGPGAPPEILEHAQITSQIETTTGLSGKYTLFKK